MLYKTRFLTIFGATCAALMVCAAVAFAATITGDDTNENLRGTNGADTINANGGNDFVNARGGNDAVDGGSGNDLLHARRGDDTSNGGDGDDKMHGGDGDDVQHGGVGNDVIFAGRGVDETFGEDGNDRLWAMARSDVSGKDDTKVDTLHGGAGDDVLRTRDGEADNIDCGEGMDTAILDRRDVIVDATDANPNGSCEKVARKKYRRGSDNSERTDVSDNDRGPSGNHKGPHTS